MPTVLRRSGPSYKRSDGSVIEPRAMVHFCEQCGAENAAFGDWKNGKLMSWCGWDKETMRPKCKAEKGLLDGE